MGGPANGPQVLAALVTNNTREFAMVPELRLENWVP